ncbi:hypothetical protein CW368_09210 [Actinomycetales bacterium SN12]|nr:hypothetical protein CW368_09210 [Actinomycetales bacterium SN12]
MAFVITTHADISQVERLVTAITSARRDVRVYISHDEAGEPGIERLEGERCRVIREAGGRGDFTQIQRILSLFELVEKDGGAEYVTVLSGQDYPARPIGDLIAALEESGDGLLHHFQALAPETSEWSMHEVRQRYLFRWRVVCQLSGTASRRLHWLHALNYMQPFFRVNVSYGSLRIARFRGSLPPGLTCHGGSAWFSVSRRAVQHVLEAAKTRPDLIEWGSTSLAIDEVFFQSILVSAGSFTFRNDNGRYIDFEGDGFGHPKVLTLDDAGSIEESGAYFVRKVSAARSLDLMARLDTRVNPSTAEKRTETI